MTIDLHDINTRLSRDPVSLCAALGLAGQKRGQEYVVELGCYGKAILPLKGAKKGIVLFTAGGPNGKQGGNMLTLCWAVLGSFPDALSWAKEYLCISRQFADASDGAHPLDDSHKRERETPRRQALWADKMTDHKIKLVQENWMVGGPIENTPAEHYLLSRGLPRMAWGDNLRYNPACTHQSLRTKLPALMGCVRDASGRIMGLKNIFLDPETHKKADITPNKPNMGACAGGAVQLHPVGENGVLALAEGIETALAVHAISLLGHAPLPCWSVLSAGGFLSFKPPAYVTQLILYPDGDLPRRLPNGTLARGVGILSCEKAATRFTEMGYSVRTAPAPQAGTDWLDVYVRHAELQDTPFPMQEAL